MSGFCQLEYVSSDSDVGMPCGKPAGVDAPIVALRSVRTVIGSYVRGNSFLGPSRVFDTHLGWGFCALHSSVISSGHFAA